MSREHGGEAGFTLIELLVSLAILGMMAALMLSGLVTGLNAWDRIERRTGDGEQILAAQDRLRSLIERLFPQGEFKGGRPTVAFSGEARSMVFSSAAIDARQPAPPWQYRLSLSSKGALMLDMYNPLAPDPARISNSQALLRGLDALEFGYYGATSFDPHPRWRTRWVASQALPQMIRIRARLRDGDRRGWPELVAAPAATIDSFCVIDRNTARCRGR